MNRRLSIFLLTALVLLPLAAQAQQFTSLYADPKANRVGDLVTVILAERTAAQRESGYENETRGRVGGAGQLSSPQIAGAFGADATFNIEGKDRNQTVQRDLLTGTFTATVTEVDQAGNLVIQGERNMEVNGVTHVMRVAGTVRPYDIRYDNTVYSFQIANANIEYRHTGFGGKWFKTSYLAILGGAAVLVAAYLFGSE